MERERLESFELRDDPRPERLFELEAREEPLALRLLPRVELLEALRRELPAPLLAERPVERDEPPRPEFLVELLRWPPLLFAARREPESSLRIEASVLSFDDEDRSAAEELPVSS